MSATLGLALLAACSHGGKPEVNAPQACAALGSAHLPVTAITATHHPEGSATVAGTALKAHCVVGGKTNERVGVDGKSFAIGFRLRLPDDWNGRLVFVGGGGNDGNVGNAIGPNVGPADKLVPAIQQGYAVVSTDGGHTGGAASEFGNDPIARIGPIPRSSRSPSISTRTPRGCRPPPSCTTPVGTTGLRATSPEAAS